MAMSWKMARYHKARYVTGMVDAAEQHYYSLVFTIKLRFHEITRFFFTLFFTFFFHTPPSNCLHQPLWTMVGGGLKSFDKSEHQMVEKVSPDVMWFQNIVTEFKPEDNKVKLICGREIEYQQLVIALGLDLKWQNIDGLMPAFENRAVGVCSNYSAFTVEKTWENIQRIGSLAKDLQGGFAKMSRKCVKLLKMAHFCNLQKIG